MKYMILRERRDDYFLKYVDERNMRNIYRRKGVALTFWYKILTHLNRRFADWFFGEWKYEIMDKSLIVIFDAFYTRRVGELIKRKKPNCRVILYFWNKISDEQKVFFGDKNIDEFWTFDDGDAAKYKMRLNPQFYTDRVPFKDRKSEYDAIFLGRKKNRSEEIEKMKRELERAGVRARFIVVDDETKFIGYDEYLSLLAKAKAIVDISGGQQAGLSLRCMEGLFFGKKVFTDNGNVKNYDFYNKNDFCVVGEGANLRKFLESDYVDVAEKVKTNYTFEAWLRRFGEGR